MPESRNHKRDPAERSAQDRAYDRVVRGDAGVDRPPGPQDAMIEEAVKAEPPADVDERASQDAVEEVRRREHSPERRADPGFRRKGG